MSFRNHFNEHVKPALEARNNEADPTHLGTLWDNCQSALESLRADLALEDSGESNFGVEHLKKVAKEVWDHFVKLYEAFIAWARKMLHQVIAMAKRVRATVRGHLNTGATIHFDVDAYRAKWLGKGIEGALPSSIIPYPMIDKSVMGVLTNLVELISKGGDWGSFDLSKILNGAYQNLRNLTCPLGEAQREYRLQDNWQQSGINRTKHGQYEEVRVILKAFDQGLTVHGRDDVWAHQMEDGTVKVSLSAGKLEHMSDDLTRLSDKLEHLMESYKVHANQIGNGLLDLAKSETRYHGDDEQMRKFHDALRHSSYKEALKVTGRLLGYTLTELNHWTRAVGHFAHFLDKAATAAEHQAQGGPKELPRYAANPA